MKNIFIKHWPYFLILLAWFIFALPFVIKGLVPYPSLFQANFFAPWSAYSIYEGPVKNNAMPDIITQIYPWRDFTIDSLKNFQIPFWNPYSFGGTPHLANYQSAVLFPLNIIFLLPLKFINSWSILVLLQPLLAGIGMILLLKSFKLSNSAASIGALSFMFCGFMVTWMGYATLGYAILPLPFAYFFINRYIDNRNIRHGVLLSFSITFSFFAGHFQTSIYFLVAVFLYILFVGFKKSEHNKLIYLLVFLTAGVLISMPQILPSIEFYSNSVRQTIISQLEVIPLQYLPSLFAPDVFGNPVTRNDWLGHYAEWNGFSGSIALLLASIAGVGLFKRSKRVIFFVMLAVASLLVAFDTPINQLIFNLKLPLFSTSASSRIIVLLSFSVAVLAAIGSDHILKNIQRITRRKIIIFVGVSSLVIFLSWSGSLLFVLSEADKFNIARNNLILPTLMSLVFIFLLIVLYIYRKKEIAKLLFVVIILVMMLVDMYRFSSKWMPFDPSNLVFTDTGITDYYKANDTHARYLGGFTAENSVYYRLQSLGGYDPLYPSRYGEFVKYVDLGIKNDGDRSVVNFPLNSPRTKKAIDYLGVEFIPQKKSDDGKSWAFDFTSYPAEEFEIVYEDDTYRVFKNKRALPRAFVVNSYEILNNDSKTLQEMFEADTDLSKVLFLEKNPLIDSMESNISSAEIISYTPNKVEINVISENKALLLLTDNFYPGWKAYVNGEKTEILRANYTFRAVLVPGGNSIVEFVYFPPSFAYGIYLALMGFTIIVIASLVYNKSYK